MEPTASPFEPKQVPFERVVKFVRHFTHDIRNGLSAMDLEAAFIAEIATDDEVRGETRKLREIVANVAAQLRQVSQYFQPVSVTPIAWEAGLFFEELRRCLEEEFTGELEAEAEENAVTETGAKADIHSPLGPDASGGAAASALALRLAFDASEWAGKSVLLDLNHTLTAVLAVVRNALQFRQAEALIQIEGKVEPASETSASGWIVLEIHEPKTEFETPVEPSEWGNDPLFSTRPGSYGLELFHARQIMEAQDGRLEIEWTGTELMTRLAWPKPVA